jgi:Putative abortive phage resistance protein AbiGi, antitoxin
MTIAADARSDHHAERHGPSGKITAMATIEELLHRRTDLSTFLVHFTRSYNRRSARNNLVSILRDRRIEARNVYGMADQLVRRFPAMAEDQKTVCFTETPLEHAWMMCRNIEGRSVQFNGHGIAFTKTFARRRGVNPVWYLDQTRGHNWLTSPVRGLLDRAVEDATPPRATTPDIERLAAAPILRLTPFIEQMGNPSGTRKEFWWEREWRHVGDLSFSTDDIVVVFAPEDEHDDLRARLSKRPRFASRTPAIASSMPAFADAQWGLERMIGALADVADLGPFPE